MPLSLAARHAGPAGEHELHIAVQWSRATMLRVEAHSCSCKMAPQTAGLSGCPLHRRTVADVVTTVVVVAVTVIAVADVFVVDVADVVL